MAKLVIFDMDGLMVDSERLTYNLWRDSCAKRGVELKLLDYASNVGKKDDDMVEHIGQLYGDRDLIMEAVLEANELLHDVVLNGTIPVKQGLFELFDELERRGIQKAVATSSNEKHAVNVLKNNGIWPRLDGAVYGSMVENGKPAPDIFLLCANNMGIAPKDCIVLEDSDAGLIGAAAAGMTPICVVDLREPSPEAAAGAKHICRSLLEVIPLLDIY